jgi:UDP-N-acetylmuramate--alanine ligase
VTSDLIADVLTARGHPPRWRGPVSELAPALGAALRPGDLVITMGAGDVTRVGPSLLAASGKASP